MKKKNIKLVAISVAMFLGAQISFAETVNDFSGLTQALKDATSTSTTVQLGNEISANATIKSGTNSPKSFTILGKNNTYKSNTLAWDVQKETTVTLKDLTLDSIQHGKSWGGAIFNEGTLNLENVTFYNNIAKTPKAVGGGAIGIASVRTTPVITNITNSTFIKNSTVTSSSYQNNGGAIYMHGTNFNAGNNVLTINSSKFEENTSNKTGGAIGVNNVGPGKYLLDIKDTTFVNNSSTGYGGAINILTNANGKVTLNFDNTTFDGNKSGSYGGAIALEKGDVLNNIINSTFKNNTATNGGGAVYNGVAGATGTNNLVISNTIFDGNSSSGKGGAIYNAGNMSLTQTQFKQSSDTIYMANGSSADFSGTNILNGAVSSENSNSTINNNGRLILNADNSGYTGIYNQIAGQTDVNISSTFFNGETTIKNGILNWNSLKDYNGVLKVENGSLNIGNTNNASLTLNNNSYIKKEAFVNIASNGKIELNGGELNLDFNDKWNGLIKNELNGILKTDNVNNFTSGGLLQHNNGISIFDNKSIITLDGKDNFILGGTVEIKNSSVLNITNEVSNNRFFVNELKMSNDSIINAMNSSINKYQISSDMIVDAKNNISIDIDGRNKVGDTFVINNLTSNSNGTLNISDFNLIGLAPIDRQLKIRVFDSGSISDKVDFTSTDKEIFTPIGYYNLRSVGSGWYTSNLTRYNPQVFRGQVATLASYNNQLVINDMLLDHITLDGERLLTQSKNANKYASTLPQFAPYQYKKENGGLWYKSYVNIEKFSLTQGLRVGNNSYGSLIGADFPVVNLKHGWKLIPTAYVGYNGAHQTFNGVGMYQNGGQGGLMGTFMKNDFIGSIVAYGGGYNNEMSVAGKTDRTGNWFAGTATKLAYNFHPTKHFTIQPTALVSYNIFGRQNWGTDFGAMSMNSGLLNGINVAPGMNLIYARESWSVYATFQYMYNINDRVSGKAGNVDLASVKMAHGYIQYGLGVTKTWKDRLNSFFQIVLRNGGRTGVGFQLGLNYSFDWFNPKSNKALKSSPKQIKKSQGIYTNQRT